MIQQDSAGFNRIQQNLTGFDRTGQERTEKTGQKKPMNFYERNVDNLVVNSSIYISHLCGASSVEHLVSLVNQV